MNFDLITSPKTIPFDRLIPHIGIRPTVNPDAVSAASEAEEDPDVDPPPPPEVWETLFSDDFNTENEGASYLSWDLFMKWNIPTMPDGTVDLVTAQNEALETLLFDYGVAVDLLGSSFALESTMETKNGINFISGSLYRFRFELGGNNRSELCQSTVTLTTGSLLEVTLTPDWEQPMTQYEYSFVAGSNSTQNISVNCVEIGGDQIPDFGCILDNVLLERRVS